MHFKIIITEGIPIPKWYGVAYQIAFKQAWVCYLIGFNLIMSLYMQARVWIKVKRYPNVLEQTFQQGYEKGRLDQQEFEEMLRKRAEKELFQILDHSKTLRRDL